MVRRLMLWLLFVAVPLQGWAAATMTVAGTHHEADSPVELVAVATAEDAAEAPSADEGTPGGAEHDCSHPARSDAKPCGACAACCLPAAVPAALQLAGPVLPAEAFPPSLAAPGPLFLNAGLERPPRRFFFL